MSFMVTIREKQQKFHETGMRLRWEVTHRFESATSREALEKTIVLLDANPMCSVSIMKKR